jgi:Domain of unknown function (DUF3472)/Domain of unknown function (DUF5077)
MRIYHLLIILLFSACKIDENSLIERETPLNHSTNRVLVPIGGNAWLQNGGEVSDKGLSKWTNSNTQCKVYFKTAQGGKFRLSLLLKPEPGSAKIQVSALGISKAIQVSGAGEKEFMVGEWSLGKATYVEVSIQGLSKTGAGYGELSQIGLSGTAITPDLSYVKDNKDNYFYWGRRGPSVHLNFPTDGKQIEWFYSEITVPKDNDVIGSYFMANGFGEGYFGIQVNSTTERRVLFSVWSPFETDNPNSIPPDQRIQLLKKGPGVYTGEFGNEGAGGQSYLVFPWKAGSTYSFLLRGKPDGTTTTYTAYFFAPEENQWRLIASFKRPKTNTYLKHLYSFLENFDPETGNQTRMALYGNQWAGDSQGKWTELSKMNFTGDNTARKNFRKDYAGGLNNGQFFLKNCGFFSDFVPLDGDFVRPAKKVAPQIDFGKLP